MLSRPLTINTTDAQVPNVSLAHNESDSSIPTTPNDEPHTPPIVASSSRCSSTEASPEAAPRKPSRFLARNPSKLAPFKETQDYGLDSALEHVVKGSSKPARPKLTSETFSEQLSGTVIVHPSPPTPPHSEARDVDPQMANLFAHRPKRRRGFDMSIFEPPSLSAVSEGEKYCRPGLIPKPEGPRRTKLKRKAREETSGSSALEYNRPREKKALGVPKVGQGAANSSTATLQGTIRRLWSTLSRRGGNPINSSSP